MILVYCDEHIAVADKASGEICEYSESGNSIPRILEEKLGKKIYTVHRLDEKTVGLCVFALTKGAASDLTRQMSEGAFNKQYLAKIEGRLDNESGVMEDLLFRDSKKNKSFAVKRERRGVRKAVLRYETLSKDESSEIVRVFLETGRTHQIRVQFASRGYPVFGDGKYGSRHKGPLCLCAYGLEFRHPASGETMNFVSSLAFFAQT